MLKLHLADLLSQYGSHTNFLPLQPPSSSSIVVAPDSIDCPLDSFIRCLSSIPLNIDLIDHFIDSPVLSQKLKTLAASLRQYPELQFYTDGSLIRDLTYIDSMGVAWTCVNNESLTFSTSAILWPSSTKAEMLVCLTALIVAPAKVQVTIFTDSVATISGMVNLSMMMQLSVRK